MYICIYIYIYVTCVCVFLFLYVQGTDVGKVALLLLLIAGALRGVCVRDSVVRARAPVANG